jgi:adenosylcobinamide-GDP ribazoletransferase
MLMPFRIALQFLTRIPAGVTDYRIEHLRQSVYWYAAVGSVIGLILWAAQTLFLQIFSWDADLIVSVLLLLVWVALTGALHLDGLADTADAWLGGQGDREKALRIMKDPQSGPAGVVAIALVLLVKFATILYLQQHQQFAYLLVVPVAARAMVPLLFFTTPYLRSEGLGSPFSDGLEFIKIIPGLAFAIALGFLGNGSWWLVAMLIAGSVFWIFRAWMMARLGGTTGDTAGAMVEILECSLLIACVWAA